jgi:Plasmid pRiA4b ORF-3-like protein
MIAQIEAGGRRGGPTTYQIQVLLSATDPPIWRRLQVPGDANLGWLHAVLQVAMGWTNSHLHQFICGENVYTDPTFDLQQYEGDPPVLDERKATVAEVLPNVGDGIVYEYDFGDSWEHLVTLEKILPASSRTRLTAMCVAGARACPPEDCGGVGGYEELLKALKNRKHPEHRSMKEWLGRPFDAEHFDSSTVNKWLRNLKWPHVTDGQLRKVLMARDDYHE